MTILSLINTVEELLDLFFPPKCQLCGEGSKEKICARCRAHFRYLESPLCRLCGSPLEDEEATLCDGCAYERPPYTFCRSVLIYEDRVRDAILKMKFQGKVSLAPILARYLVSYLDENAPIFGADLVVPVPKGGGGRGIPKGSAAALCSLIKSHTEYPVEQILERTRHTSPQRTLNLLRRWENVAGAFAVQDGEDIRGKRILLIDDIFTSGATITHCTKALLSAGAAEVKALTLARALGDTK